MKQKIKWVVLQSLIGGFPLGTEKATGSLPEAMISCISGKANNVHYINYCKERGHELKCAYVDDTTLEPIDEESRLIIEELKNSKINIAVGTAYCAGLSMLNASKGSKAKGADADQNENMYALARLAMDWIKPEVYIFENAPGLYTKLGKGVADKLRLIAEDFDYSTSMFKTDTFLHGIPQHRDRTFMYFWRQDGKEVKTPILNYFKADTPLIEEYLKKIPLDATYQDKPNKFCNMKVLKPFIDYAEQNIGKDWRGIITDNYTKKVNTIAKYLIKTNTVKDFVAWAKTQSYEDKIKDMMIKRIEHSEKKINAGKNYWEFSPVVLTTHSVNAITGKAASHFLHPTEDRGYTLRELMHLMGLPHDFQLVTNSAGSIEENHVAQNVPVTTARDIIINAIAGINGELDYLHTHHVKQSNYKQTIDEGDIESDSYKLF